MGYLPNTSTALIIDWQRFGAIALLFGNLAVMPYAFFAEEAQTRTKLLSEIRVVQLASLFSRACFACHVKISSENHLYLAHDS